MSLLMDALKKAEQEKKEAAQRLRDTAERGGTPDDQEPLPEPSEEVEATGEYEAPQTEENRDRLSTSGSYLSTMELKLEPIESQQKTTDAVAQDVDEGDVTAKIPVEDVPIDENLLESQADAGADEISTGESTLIEEISDERTNQSPDSTFHGVLLEETESPDQNAEMFEQTQQGEPYIPDESRSYDETLPGVSAAQLSEDIGDNDLPTPVAAQTVFTASGSHAKPKVNWLLYSGLAAIVLVAVGVVIYFSITPVTRELPQQLVTRAQGIEQSGFAQNTVDITQHAVTANITPVTELANPLQVEAEETLSGVITEQAAVDVTTDSTEATVETTEQSSVETSVADESVANEFGDSDETFAEEAEPLPLRDRITVSRQQLQITKAKVTEQKSKEINLAYKDYQAGRLLEARARYEEVLESYPDNRDALLGLAAISIRESDLEAAQAMYAHLLQINPLDDLARAGLIGLQDKNLMAKGESTIKSMLHDQPDNPYLYFTLGKIYAKQQRWAEAQQSFFDAYRLESSNPNYALNLAISLDQMGQADTALDYYQVALDLAQTAQSNFNDASVQNRIQVLSAVTQQ